MKNITFKKNTSSSLTYNNHTLPYNYDTINIIIKPLLNNSNIKFANKTVKSISKITSKLNISYFDMFKDKNKDKNNLELHRANKSKGLLTKREANEKKRPKEAPLTVDINLIYPTKEQAWKSFEITSEK